MERVECEGENSWVCLLARGMSEAGALWCCWVGAEMVSVVPASCWEREAIAGAEAERQKEDAIVVAIAALPLAMQRNATIPW